MGQPVNVLEKDQSNLIYLTNNTTPPTDLSSSQDAMIYAQNGNIYYSNATSSGNQLLSSANLSGYVTTSSLASGVPSVTATGAISGQTVTSIGQTKASNVYLPNSSSAPSNPTVANDVILYAQNGNLYYLNSANVTTKISSTPIGTMIMWAGGATPPADYLECDGSSISQTTYSSLYAVVGTTWGDGKIGKGGTSATGAVSGNFNLPDTRGYFPRGWNHSAAAAVGVDPDANTRAVRSPYSGGATADNIGSYQDQNIIGHTHTVSTTLAAAGSGQSVNNVSVTGSITSGSASSIGNFTETRPKNFYVMFCIKYQ